MTAGTALDWSAARWYRPTMLGLAVAMVMLLAFELATVLPRAQPASYGVDFHQYLGHADRWLAGGSLYLDRQLHGPYAVTGGDSLYPPPILYLLVPFVVGVPQLAWWIVPLAVIGFVVVRHRPEPWAWPVMLLLLATPRSLEIVLYGNPVMWVAAALALATLGGGWAVAVLLKPTLAPLALWGAHRRSWWLVLAVAVVASAPFGMVWVEWIRVVADSDGSLLYSLPDLLFVAVPLVAWVSRAGAPGARWSARSRRRTAPGRAASR